MAMNETVVYQDLEDIYVLCMRKVIAEVCSDLWRKEPDGVFTTFKKYDLANTKEVNDQKAKEKKEAEKLLKEGKIESINYDKYKPIVAITSKAKAFKKFDFQACNNTLAYIEPVYTKIAQKYNFNADTFVNTSKELSKLRNKLAHPDPNDSPSKIVGYQKSCINYMNFMFGLGFENVKNENGETFYQQFQKNYLAYMEKDLQRWYYLTDFLDLTLYDATRFLEVCATNNIKADKKDAKYLFCTSNLEKTVEILKNSLATMGDNVQEKRSAPAVQQTAPQTQPQKKSNKTLYLVLGIIAALFLGGAIIAAAVIPAITNLFGTVFGGSSSDLSLPQMPAVNNSSVAVNTNSSEITQSENEVTSSAEVSSAEVGGGENQVPSKYEQDIESLKYASELVLRNRTINISVGSFATPPPALVWDNVTIYSQDTGIAVGEGSLVKGVAPGTTYIIVESELGSASAFYVVVK